MRNLDWRGRLFWMVVATASFHAAYASPSLAFLIGVYLFAVFQLTRQSSRLQTMNTGWVLGLLLYGPHLSFFYVIFGLKAIGLWLVLAFWLALFLALVRFTRAKMGVTAAAILTPCLWLGLEYFRSELYPLRFSWLNAGYAFAWTHALPTLGWLGVYGIGLVLMTIAVWISHLRGRQQWTSGLAALGVLALLSHVPFKATETTDGTELQVAGIQLEFPSEAEVMHGLDQLYQEHPEADLYVLSEYTFDGPVPKQVIDWCKRHKTHLLAGGKEQLSDNQYFNTAYVVGPDGEVTFKQAKAQPIQFMNDGLPATEQKVWQSPWGTIGICICYDLSYTRVVDNLADQGAETILVPTMDVQQWGRYEHRLHARVGPSRAAEYRVPIFRLASSGVSQLISRHGDSVESELFPGEGEILAGTLHLSGPARLPLDRWLAWPALAVTGTISLWALWLALWTRTRQGTP